MVPVSIPVTLDFRLQGWDQRMGAQLVLFVLGCMFWGLCLLQSKLASTFVLHDGIIFEHHV